MASSLVSSKEAQALGNGGQGSVCQVVHQTAPSDRSRWDPRWERCRQSWQKVCPSPEFVHVLWDDDGLRSLVEEAFPEYLEVYDRYEQHIQRVDFARAAMLYLHGGLYVDMDVEAVQAGDYEQVEQAASAGADLECRDYAGLAPAHHAALRGDARMVRLLAVLRADLGSRDKNATTPLHYAVQVSKIEATSLLAKLRSEQHSNSF
ncbi:unnamed protein product, partial [Polarella glacialis]